MISQIFIHFICLLPGHMVYFTEKGLELNPNKWIMQKERGTSSFIFDLDFNTTYFFKVRTFYGSKLGPFSAMIDYTTENEDLDFENNFVLMEKIELDKKSTID